MTTQETTLPRSKKFIIQCETNYPNCQNCDLYNECSPLPNSHVLKEQQNSETPRMLPNTKADNNLYANDSNSVFDLFKRVKLPMGFDKAFSFSTVTDKNNHKFVEGWKWSLSGHLYNPRRSCGKVLPIGCDNFNHHVGGVGHANLMVLGCKRLGCPICYETASSHRSMVITLRFAKKVIGDTSFLRDIAKQSQYESKQKMKQKVVDYVEKRIKRSNIYNIKHVVASPPQDSVWDNKKYFDVNRKQAYSLLKKCGVRGGVLFPHPYRLKCADCDYHPIPDHRQECPNCHSDRFIWYFSPHYHIIGYGWVKNTKKTFQSTGWVIKNLGIRKSIYSTAQYILSHAGVNRRSLSINWFGELNRQKLGKTPRLPTIKQCCHECYKPYTLLQWQRLDRPPPKLVYNINGENQFTFKQTDYVAKLKI